MNKKSVVKRTIKNRKPNNRNFYFKPKKNKLIVENVTENDIEIYQDNNVQTQQNKKNKKNKTNYSVSNDIQIENQPNQNITEVENNINNEDN